MPLFGHKSSRTSRTSRAKEIGSTASLRGWVRKMLHDHGVQLRLLICLGAVAALLVVVEGWRPPETVRTGDLPGQGLAAGTAAAASPTLQLARAGVVLGLLLVLAVLNGAWLARTAPELIGHAGRLGVFLAAIVLAVGVARLLSVDPWRAEVIPVLASVMIFAIAWNQVVAIQAAVSLSLLVTLSTVVDIGHFVVLLSVSATAILPLSQVSSRSTVIKVGFWSGLVYVAVDLGTVILAGSGDVVPLQGTAPLWHALPGFLWCLAAGYLVAGTLPLIERAFGVVTNISLLEMGDASHPLLRELVQRAPGTHNHSIVVGTIGEAAADRIGANGLLVRVGAYFHDIGKMLKPEYFVENMTEGMQSRHDQLAPAMSTLIIIGHVKDGVELARQHNLPHPLIDFIEQHHGTTLVEYFFHEAEKQAGDQPDHRTDAEEASFRYPGPRPRTREAGVMMLADAVESASRALEEPTPRRLENLVNRITIDRLLDGQFEQSGLNLTEIHLVEESLTKSLIGIYHGRVAYPEQRTA